MKLIMVVLAWVLASFQTPLPAINQQIVDFTKAHQGKQLDRGECWDLAKAALDNANAEWNGEYVYGTKYDYKKGPILPGDVIQFEDVVFKGEFYSMSMPHHTAIVLEVVKPLVLKIAHQNFAGKLTVEYTEVNFNDLKKGKVFFYHPKPRKI